MNGARRTIVVIGGGFSGSLFALKMSRARPQDRVVLVERSRRLGRGVAYGACSPEHLLNVPVSRMEVGLAPGFCEWLSGQALSDLPPRELQDAFVPRALFGDYMEAQARSARSSHREAGLHTIRGEAVGLLDAPGFGVRLWDGREVEADLMVLALGNLPPRAPGPLARIADDAAIFVPDPWAHDAFEALGREEPVLLVGAGLTAVDIALRLDGEGHRGPILAVSRHGLLPQRHRSGGAWPPFLEAEASQSPSVLTRRLRREVRRAEAAGAPWQRVLDAARPSVAAVWHGWSLDERRRFLRHLRPYWDIHRHRMAPPIADRLEALIAGGRLRVEAGRISKVTRSAGGAQAEITRRGGGRMSFEAARIVNCTGPRSDFDTLAAPLVSDLRRRGLMMGDALALGLETSACAVVDDSGRASERLYALGPLTRAAWWEVVAVPEIAIQIGELVAQLSAIDPPATSRSLALAFNDIGAGI